MASYIDLTFEPSEDDTSDGAETDGVETDGAKTDRVESGGAEADGFETDAAEIDGAETDEAEINGVESDEAEIDAVEIGGVEIDEFEPDAAGTDEWYDSVEEARGTVGKSRKYPGPYLEKLIDQSQQLSLVADTHQPATMLIEGCLFTLLLVTLRLSIQPSELRVTKYLVKSWAGLLTRIRL